MISVDTLVEGPKTENWSWAKVFFFMLFIYFYWFISLKYLEYCLKLYLKLKRLLPAV